MTKTKKVLCVVHSILRMTTYCWRGYYWSAAYKWWPHSHPSSWHTVCPGSENWKQMQRKTETKRQKPLKHTVRTFSLSFTIVVAFVIIHISIFNVKQNAQNCGLMPDLQFTHGASIRQHQIIIKHHHYGPLTPSTSWEDSLEEWWTTNRRSRFIDVASNKIKTSLILLGFNF